MATFTIDYHNPHVPETSVVLAVPCCSASNTFLYALRGSTSSSFQQILVILEQMLDFFREAVIIVIIVRRWHLRREVSQFPQRV